MASGSCEISQGGLRDLQHASVCIFYIEPQFSGSGAIKEGGLFSFLNADLLLLMRELQLRTFYCSNDIKQSPNVVFSCPNVILLSSFS